MDFLLVLHNLLRWVILILLIVVIIQSFSGGQNSKVQLKKISLPLLIAAHTTLVIGLYQWLTGTFGLKLITANGFGEVMKNSAQRFWAVEHITGMLIAIILITVARGKVKKMQSKKAGYLYIIALIIILASIPWPFREAIARPLVPGM